jgi:ribonucleoside-diphosphate reductase alpha chain
MYKREEVYKATLEYFKGDILAADVWVNKYSLKDTVDGGRIDDNTTYFELTPNDMHRRLASELYRIESKYVNPLSENVIFDLLKDFKYIVPQGSPMAGIGNNKQTVSLSNCFVVGNDADSYGGIFLIDQEQAQLMKRRGGVGHDLSHIRPKGMRVKNSALTSTGIVPFMERYSNTTEEVAQDGRRGALMLSCFVKHPDSESFIDAKLEDGKITGANISIKLDDDFMKSAISNKKYTQSFPIDSDEPKLTKVVDAKPIWDKIIHNAWKSAEPGILFWDTIMKESVADCYQEHGFETVSTNPCGEIPLCPYDSCRLLAINLYSYVVNPFSKDAYFDEELFAKHAQYAQRFMDDIVDLELEKIDKILEKIKSDPEEEHIKRIESDLWLKIKNMSEQGRRTGLGITAEGDMIAALGLTYGTKKASNFSTKVHKILAINAYKSSTIMAEERGSFPVYDYKKELNNPFINRLKNDGPELVKMLKKGRRNISLLTIAPTGSVSIMTQTSSGIEPVYLVSYKRRRKINPNDKDSRTDFIDDKGVHWEEYNIFHHKFLVWLEVKGYDIDEVKKLKDVDLQEIIKKSPYYNATSNDIDWLEKVKMQGKVQKYVDHSISVTVNLPNDATEEMVSNVYETGWKSGCKGITVYRDGSRQGVILSHDEKTIEEQMKENNAPRRPKRLECDVIRFTNNKEKWLGILGIYDEENGEKYPYELFTGLLESFQIPNYVEHGVAIKNKEEDGHSRYDFEYSDKDGYIVTMQGLNRAFNREFWNYSKMLSAFLRHKLHLPSVLNIVDGMNMSINGEDELHFGTWKAGVKRILKKWIKDSVEINGEVCPDCGSDNLSYNSGCKTCTCGWTACS